MKLPDPERVIYKRNPLVDVVSQLRFPPILKIANEDPVQFQDAIRDAYPLLEIENSFVLIESDDQSIADPKKNDITYKFSSEDLKWQISLNKNFLAFATKNYERYEDFKNRLKKVCSVFEKLYKPSFYTRVGLRYQDLIVRSNLDLSDQAWPELIPVHIAPELHFPEMSEAIITSTKLLTMKSGSGQVSLRHGLVEARDVEKNLTELAYLIDADFYTEERVARGDYVWEQLDEYNHAARQLFRWCISDKLHLAMEPTPVASEAHQS
jgi:uncharacterized protein (TIGR04255 family)